MRVGIFGGSFDPIHYGHLILADRCREELSLDKVLFVLAATSPLKSDGPVASNDQRVEMLSLALSGNDAFEINRCEIERGGISYTIDTVTAIQNAHPKARLFLLMGSDLLRQLDSWKQPSAIFAIATPAILNRGGRPPATLADIQPYLAAGEEDRPIFLQMPQVELSSTELRQRVGAKKSIRYQMPRSVEEYIRSERLYVD